MTHIDASARNRTIAREENPLYCDLIRELDRLTGGPVITNTSMDHLVIGNCLLDKRQMKPLKEDVDWRDFFQLD